MNNFNLTIPAQQIVFGSGTLAKLGEYLAPFGLERLVLCTSPSMRGRGYVEQIEHALGARLVAAYERTQAHVLDTQLAESLALAEANRADAIIGMGGGSAIGIAKATAARLEEKRTGTYNAPSPVAQPQVPVIAIPTTYAGSEMTPVYGVTHAEADAARKITVRNIKIAPKLVLYDPQLTLELPREVTAGTGINALAHCIEALYSVTGNPLAAAAARAGIEHITRALPRCYADGTNLAARTDMLVGAHLGGAALATVSMALHHGLCHILGGTAGVPHGVANAIILPHAMRFNRDAAAAPLAVAAQAMGIARGAQSDVEMADAAAAFAASLVGALGLPQRLRDAGVAETDLAKLAELAYASATVRQNPRPIESAAQLETLLRAAW